MNLHRYEYVSSYLFRREGQTRRQEGTKDDRCWSILPAVHIQYKFSTFYDYSSTVLYSTVRQMTNHKWGVLVFSDQMSFSLFRRCCCYSYVMLVFCVDAERDRRLDVRLHACHVNEFVVSADTTCLCPDACICACEWVARRIISQSDRCDCINLEIRLPH